MLGTSEIIRKLEKFLNHGHERTIRAKKNILISFFLKGADVLIGIILVPISISYLGTTNYGVWLTISSLTTWMIFFDVGLGNGLRNKFAEAVALGNDRLAREYVSSAYATLLIVVSFLILLFVFLNSYLDWTLILNSPPELRSNLSVLALIVFIAFAVRLVLKLISDLLLAYHRTALRDFILVLGRVLTLGLIIILSKKTNQSLVYFGSIYSLAPLVVLFISTVLLFKLFFREYQPSFQSINWKSSGSLFTLGVNFFVIQISITVLFMTDNVIISQLFGPAEVTPYHIAHKYFGVVLMGFTVVMSPFWSSFTEAYARKDITWIRRIIRNLLKVWIATSILAIILLVFSGFIYELWIGNQVRVEFQISLFWAVFVILQSLNMIYTFFLNGVGKIKIQMLTAVVTIFLNIPLSILFSYQLGLGPSGVILATNVSILMYIVFRSIQTYKILSGKAIGIWNS